MARPSSDWHVLRARVRRCPRGIHTLLVFNFAFVMDMIEQIYKNFYTKCTGQPAAPRGGWSEGLLPGGPRAALAADWVQPLRE